MKRFFVVFVVMLSVLFLLELTPIAQQYVVAPWTRALAAICAAIVRAFDPGVVAAGQALFSSTSQFAVSIEAGCNGIEATLVLVAAIVAYPASVRGKVAGLLGGIVAVQALNIVRVISLFYIGQWNMRAFEWAHLYVWQALIMLDVLIVWLVWVRLAGRGDASPAPPGVGPPAPASA